MSMPSSRNELRAPARAAALLAGVLLACSAAAPAAAQDKGAEAAPARSAREFAVQAIGDVTVILKDKASTQASRRARIEALVERWLDAEVISKLTLAKNWKSFDAAQQQEFVRLFRKHLVLTYYRNVDRYAFERIDVYEDRAEGKGDATVRTRVVSPEAGDVLIDLRLRPTGGDWKAIDILIEGVSLVQNFRSQFQEVLSNGKPEQLLRSLREKNEATEAKHREAEEAELAGKAEERAPQGG
ncbi:MAG: ABC transporter substrate-binding protein [Planctomycetes bacterium]|nr:ABC transporter substrate-binding protein [Planctomycetota bacterium]